MIDGLCIECGKHYTTSDKYKYTYICHECLQFGIILNHPKEYNDYLIWDNCIFLIEPYLENYAVYQYLMYEDNIRRVSHQPIMVTDGTYQNLKDKLTLLVTLLGAYPVWANQITSTIKLLQSEKLLEEHDRKWEWLNEWLESQYTMYSEVLKKPTLAKWFKMVWDKVITIFKGVDPYDRQD